MEIRNPKSELMPGCDEIPNSEFRIPNSNLMYHTAGPQKRASNETDIGEENATNSSLSCLSSPSIAILTGCAKAPTVDPLPNGLLLGLAVLESGPSGPVPQPAQLGILTNDGTAWSYRFIEDEDSNVFHKGMVFTPDGRPGRHPHRRRQQGHGQVLGHPGQPADPVGEGLRRKIQPHARPRGGRYQC